MKSFTTTYKGTSKNAIRTSLRGRNDRSNLHVCAKSRLLRPDQGIGTRNDGKVFRDATKLLISILLMCAMFHAHAQTKVQVITTTIEKSFPYTGSELVVIQGEKASIIIKDWDKQELKVTLKLTSKHSDKTVAGKELNYMRYVLEKDKKGIMLKNYFAIPKGTSKVNAVLKAEYEIYVPSKSPFNIKNNYGNIVIKNINGKLNINQEYGTIDLQNINGEVNINSHFGDITGEKTTGTFNLKTNHSDIALNNMKGNYDIDAIYGEISLTPVNKIFLLKVKSINGDIELETGNFNQYNYNLTTSYGNIKLPSGNKCEFSEFSESKKRMACYPVADNPILQLTTSFGNLVIK